MIGIATASRIPVISPGFVLGQNAASTRMAMTAANPSPTTQLIVNAPSQWSASPRSRARSQRGQRARSLNHDARIPLAPHRGQRSLAARASLSQSEVTPESTAPNATPLHASFSATYFRYAICALKLISTPTARSGYLVTIAVRSAFPSADVFRNESKSAR